MNLTTETTATIEKTEEIVSANGASLQLEEETITAAIEAIASELTRTSSSKQPALQKHLDCLKNAANLLATQDRELTVGRSQTAPIITTMRQSPDRLSLLHNTVTAVREQLDASRVLLYRFLAEDKGKGEVVAESLVSGWTPTIEEVIPAVAFGRAKAEEYLQEEAVQIAAEAGRLTPYQIQLLEGFQVKASLAIPILLASEQENGGYHLSRVWGLLVVQQCDGPRHWGIGEMNLLSQIGTELSLALQWSELQDQLQQQLEREKALAHVMRKIQQYSDLSKVFKTATQELRQILNCDRVMIYRFNADWSGQVLVESVGREWVSVLEVQQGDRNLFSSEMTLDERCDLNKLGREEWPLDTDTYLQETKGGKYAQGKQFTAVEDIYAADFSFCYLESLEKYQARAYSIVPLMKDKQLWGLLAAYQNSGPRHWNPSEINLMLQLSGTLGVAISQTEVVAKLEEKSQQLEKTAALEMGLVAMVERMRLNRNLDYVFQVATREARKLLEVDRVVIYRYNQDWSGEFVAESVVSGWVKLMEDIPYVKDSYLEETKGGRYKDNESLVVDNIYTAGHDSCHLELLEQFQTKAYIIVPILVGDKLWGLLGAYENSGPRKWIEAEVNVLKEIGVRIGNVLQETEYINKLQQQSQTLAKAAKRETNFVRLLGKINQKLMEESQERLKLEGLFRICTRELRKILASDRVAVLQFNPDGRGTFVAEDMVRGYGKLVGGEGTHLEDPDLQDTQGGLYSQNQILVVNDIKTAEISESQLESMAQIGANACVIAPIFKGETLWGLLAAYQGNPRVWEEGEKTLLVHASAQLGVAIQQSEYLEKVQAQAAELSLTVEREKAAKEEIQNRAIELLIAVQPASSGDLTVRAAVTNDEIGTIAGAYNTTIDALRDIVLQVQEAAEQVARTTGGSTAGIEKLASQAGEQFEALNRALEKIQAMVVATEATTDNARQVGVAVGEANKTLTAGDKAMNKTVDSIVAIRETVAETGKRVQRLRSSSQKISKVVGLISNFANQTNLLALNAALEATRAGEFGKGFAVVADEVRNLAHQSAEATADIEKLVQEIQGETQQVAAAMETGIQQVVEGTNLVNETRESLTAIVDATAEISQLVAGINKTAELQKAEEQEVTEVMNLVAAIANDTDADSRQIAASFQELLAMARNLEESAAQFKVS